MNGLHDETKFLAEYSEEGDNILLVDGSAAQASEVDGPTMLGASHFGPRGCHPNTIAKPKERPALGQGSLEVRQNSVPALVLASPPVPEVP